MSLRTTSRVAAGLLTDPGHFIALGAGSGLAPHAPGTCGSAVGLACFLGLSQLGAPGYLAAVALMFLVGVPICARTARALGVHDHPAIVWDEVVGMLVTMAFGSLTVASMIAGFALFRLFDIWKPWPIRVLDARTPGGLGIMLDDLGAALFAGLGLALFEYISYS